MYNLGLGRGVSVRELCEIFTATTGMQVPVKVGQRRYGDVGTLVCSANKSYIELEWKPEYNLTQMCKPVPSQVPLFGFHSLL